MIMNKKISIFVSLPNEAKGIYRNAVKPLERGNVGLVCFLDRPVGEAFEQNIRSYISLCNVVIAILMEERSNVLYEIGLAKGYGKPVVLLAESLEQVPSMLRSYDVILFDVQAQDWTELLKRITQVVENLLCGDPAFLTDRIWTHSLIFCEGGAETAPGTWVSEQPLEDGTDFLGAAIACYMQKRFERAIALLSPRFEQGGCSQEVYERLADCHFMLAESLPDGVRKFSNYERQLQVAEVGLSKYPASQFLLKTIGLAHLKLKNLAKAESTFREMLGTDPAYEHATYNLACVYAQMGKLLDCIALLLPLFSKSPKWRILARMDPDFAPLWPDGVFQRVLYPGARPNLE